MTLKESAYATLAYFDLFDYPLTIQEIERYLLWSNASRNELWTFLNNDAGVQRHGNYYFLKGRREILDTRREREVVATGYWQKVKKFLPLLQMIPYVRMVAVCNTLAFNNPTKESDIDLFVVVKRGRLFLARTFATILFTILGVRRHGRKIAGRFCLSFYVTEDALNIEGVKRGPDDIYLPYWLLTLKPVYGEAVYEELLRQNTWIQKYFPRSVELENGAEDDGNDSAAADSSRVLKNRPFLRGIAGLQEKIYDKKLGDKLEAWIAGKQMARHQRNFRELGPDASVVVSDSMLKFHNIDRRREFAEKFQKRYQEIMGQV